MKRSLAVLLPLALVACQDAHEPLAPTGEELSPSFAASPAAGAIPGRFIVTLREGAGPAAVAADHGVRPDFVYRHALNGFAGAISEAARSGLLRDARVVRIEQDGVVTASTVQSGATWGIDRTDQRALPLSGTYSYASTGAGVTAYIIDTGIRLDHAEFGGRAAAGYDAIGDGQNGNDCNGHGTHVAGTVGGATYGIAKGTKLVAVRVLSCSGSGSNSGVIAGMDWVVANHAAGTPAVANMSLGGGASTATDDAVQRMIDDGVTVAVAAGNDNRDACRFSPARAPNAITVGATTKTDYRASYSNYGRCLDVFAAGSGITSAWYTGSTATNTISGTSMATPHVAGVAALYLQNNSGATPAQVTGALANNATNGVVISAGRNSVNKLLFSNY